MAGSQTMMRGRIAAQGFTVIAVILGNSKHTFFDLNVTNTTTGQCPYYCSIFYSSPLDFHEGGVRFHNPFPYILHITLISSLVVDNSLKNYEYQK